MNTMIRLFKSEEGASAIEYARIAALIAIVAITAMGTVGNSVKNSFSAVSSSLNSAQVR